MRALMVVGRVCVISCVLYASIGSVSADARWGATALTNPDIINCSSVAYKKVDKLLNEQYKALMLELDSPLGEIAERCKARMQFQMPIY